MRKQGRLGLNELFNMMKNGVSHDEMFSQIELAERIDREKRQRGHDSEEYVCEVLSMLHYLDRVVIVSGDENADRAGHDLKAVVNSHKFYDEFGVVQALSGGVVYVQVKSAPKYVSVARQIMARRHQVGLNDVDKFFHKERLIMIDASTGETRIQNIFAAQLVAMNRFIANVGR